MLGTNYAETQQGFVYGWSNSIRWFSNRCHHSENHPSGILSLHDYYYSSQNTNRYRLRQGVGYRWRSVVHFVTLLLSFPNFFHFRTCLFLVSKLFKLSQNHAPRTANALLLYYLSDYNHFDSYALHFCIVMFLQDGRRSSIVHLVCSRGPHYSGHWFKSMPTDRRDCDCFSCLQLLEVIKVPYWL